MGKKIKNFNPINISALIHYLDHHNCPNGLMPVFALVLMILSEYTLSFKAAHELICDFAREQHTVNGKKDFANLLWLNISEWSDEKNNTAEKIFGGKYKASIFRNFSTPSHFYFSPLPTSTQP